MFVHPLGLRLLLQKRSAGRMLNKYGDDDNAWKNDGGGGVNLGDGDGDGGDGSGGVNLGNGDSDGGDGGGAGVVACVAENDGGAGSGADGDSDGDRANGGNHPPKSDASTEVTGSPVGVQEVLRLIRMGDVKGAQRLSDLNPQWGFRDRLPMLALEMALEYDSIGEVREVKYIYIYLYRWPDILYTWVD